MSRFSIAFPVLAVLCQTLSAADKDEFVVAFDEQFEENSLLKRFKIGRSSREFNLRYDRKNQSYSLEGYVSLVRPAQAGPTATLDLKLIFEAPPDDAPARTHTSFMFALSNGSGVGIEIHRTKSGEPPPVVKFVALKPGKNRPDVLRTIPLDRREADGIWQLQCRHGLLTLRQGREIPGLVFGDTFLLNADRAGGQADRSMVGHADAGVLGAQVLGVVWIENGGKLSIERMTLSGEPIRKLGPLARATLKRAAALNTEAMQLRAKKKFSEALPVMKEASSLYAEVHGERHHDVANSYANIATLLEDSGRVDQAAKYWNKVIAIDEAVLGATHPHTTLMQFMMAKNSLVSGDSSTAKRLLIQCRDRRRSVLSPDDSLVKSIDKLLVSPRLRNAKPGTVSDPP